MTCTNCSDTGTAYDPQTGQNVECWKCKNEATVLYHPIKNEIVAVYKTTNPSIRMVHLNEKEQVYALWPDLMILGWIEIGEL